MSRIQIITIVILLGIVFTAVLSCDDSEETPLATAIPTPTLSPTLPTPIPTITPSPTPTLTPTFAPDPTPSPTPTPTLTPEPTPPVTVSPTPISTPIDPPECEADRIAIKTALDIYYETNGQWPTSDGQYGRILWDNLVPDYLDQNPTTVKCNWKVSDDPDLEVCRPASGC